MIDKDGELRTIRAGKEVILAAGVFGSPQILMLSGIGHPDHLAQHGIPVLADLPVGDNMHDHLFVPLTFHVPTAKHRGNAVALRPRAGQGGHGRQLVPRELGLRVRRVRAYVAGDRRTRPADPPAAVVVPVAQPGRADPAQGRPARVRDAAVDADLPAQPRHPPARVGRPDGGAADRLPVPRRAGRRRGARRGLRDDPRDHGQRGVRRRGQERGAHGHRLHRRRRCATRSATARPPSTTASAPAGWASTSGPWSAPTSRCAASRACASPTPRSCRRSPAATPTHRRS